MSRTLLKKDGITDAVAFCTQECSFALRKLRSVPAVPSFAEGLCGFRYN